VLRLDFDFLMRMVLGFFFTSRPLFFAVLDVLLTWEIFDVMSLSLDVDLELHETRVKLASFRVHVIRIAGQQRGYLNKH